MKIYFDKTFNLLSGLFWLFIQSFNIRILILSAFIHIFFFRQDFNTFFFCKLNFQSKSRIWIQFWSFHEIEKMTNWKSRFEWYFWFVRMSIFLHFPLHSEHFRVNFVLSFTLSLFFSFSKSIKKKSRNFSRFFAFSQTKFFLLRQSQKEKENLTFLHTHFHHFHQKFSNVFFFFFSQAF